MTVTADKGKSLSLKIYNRESWTKHIVTHLREGLDGSGHF